MAWDQIQNLGSHTQDEEMKQDLFQRLPDDVVMLIINKLIRMKTLFLFFLVANRYSSLVTKTHSLFVDLHTPTFLGRLGDFLGNLVAKFKRAPTPIVPSPINQKISAIEHGFKQLKHLHLHFGDNYVSPSKPNRFCRSVTLFWSHIKLCHLVIATSVNQSNFDLDGPVGSSNGDGMDDFIGAEKIYYNLCPYGYDCFFGGDVFIMGKEQIARLQSNEEQVSANPATLQLSFSVRPKLHVPKSNYTMTNVAFVCVTLFMRMLRVNMMRKACYFECKQENRGGKENHTLGWSPIYLPRNRSSSSPASMKDQFEGLPDDVVMIIINKLIHIKTLTLFTLVSKRYSFLVSQTDSLFVFVELPDHEHPQRRRGFLRRFGGLLSNLVAKFIRASSLKMVDPYTQKIHAVHHDFQYMKISSSPLG
ncbi:hypothetical protein COLO4_37558 [Corchorus olitorius]|uniref:F-box domain-containing protein n=1 Tax=Corchorus olitorius TaxID=93759 RepID=A0A1R3G0Z0_9ROSI|nr:hypothetical protein COLO4_37558 [Corchorus olitorius]